MQLNHYLNFKGQTEQAFLFYQSVFGGEFSVLSRYGDMPPAEGANLSEVDKSLILHVSLPITEIRLLPSLIDWCTFSFWVPHFSFL